jgi:beta-N-acetylhexosaminidase
MLKHSPRSRLYALAAAGAALAACAPAVPAARGLGAPTAPRTARPLEAPLSDRDRRWVDSTLASLSLRERVAQMTMVWVLGDYANAADPSFLKVREWIERDRVGGVVMSLGSPLEVAAKVNAMQRLARVPLLVASDIEPGLGRLEAGVFAPQLWSAGSATVLPTNMAIGAGGRESDAYEAGRITGREARAVGIHLAFAPAVDVNNNPANPVINVRSFGERPGAVSRLGAAFIRGVQGEGVAATAKHFPRARRHRRRLARGAPHRALQPAAARQRGARPLPRGDRAGVAAVMTAHIALPAVAGDSTPATLSRSIMTGLLRDTLGFRGITITDAMTMEGVGSGYPIERSGPLAVQAGDDLLLMPTDVPRMLDAVVASVERGEITRARIDSATRKVLELKVRTGAVAQPLVSLEALREVVGAPAHWAAARGIAERAVTLLRDTPQLVPTGTARTFALVQYAPDNEVTAGAAFAAQLRADVGGAAAAPAPGAPLPGGATVVVPAVREFRISPRTSAAALDSVAAAFGSADRVIVTTYTRTYEGEGRVAIPTHVAQWIDAQAATGKLIVVAGGNPYVIRQFPRVSSYLVTYGRGEALERAAARAVVGRAPITGTAPISLPATSPRAPASRAGPRRERTARGARALAVVAACAAGAAGPPRGGAPRGHGRSAGGGGRDRQRAPRAGRGRRRQRLPRRVRGGRAARRGDRRVRAPGTSTGRVPGRRRPGPRRPHPLGPRLAHESGGDHHRARAARGRGAGGARRARCNATCRPGRGPAARRSRCATSSPTRAACPAWRPLYKEATSPAAALALVYATDVDTVPGVRYLYSDLGAILLGEIVARVAGERLDAYASRALFAPLGMRTRGSCPPEAERARTAPTEYDPWRQRHLRGEVHDENAHALGGVAGHAGLFGTADDLVRFARLYLGGGELDGRRHLDARVVAEFARRQDSLVSHRALGGRPATGQNSAGRALSTTAFGTPGSPAPPSGSTPSVTSSSFSSRTA